MGLLPAEYLEKFVCPICNQRINRSEYLAGVFSENLKLEWFANLITHYRHSHIASWNKMWGHHGRSYRRAAKFGNYEEEKIKVNNRAKRQIIRVCAPLLILLDIKAVDIASLQYNDLETLKVANGLLNGKYDIPDNFGEQQELPPLNADDIMGYGIHHGKPLRDIPGEYWLWLWDNNKLENRPRYKKWVEENLSFFRPNKN